MGMDVCVCVRAAIFMHASEQSPYHYVRMRKWVWIARVGGSVGGLVSIGGWVRIGIAMESVCPYSMFKPGPRGCRLSGWVGRFGLVVEFARGLGRVGIPRKSTNSADSAPLNGYK